MNDETRDENQLIAERRAKLQALRGEGIAFPNDFRRGDYAADLQREYGDAQAWTAEVLEGVGRHVFVAGRMVAKRVMGKASFVQLQDMSGRIQLYLTANELGEAYEDFKGWDVGDIIGVSTSRKRRVSSQLRIAATIFERLTNTSRASGFTIRST